MDYKRFENESALEFQYRVSQDKSLIGTWQDVADICNSVLGYDYTESKYRKDYVTFQKMFSANQASIVDCSERLKDIERKEFELRKEKQRLFDQRREYNKLASYEARAEHLEECLTRAAAALKEECPLLIVDGDKYIDPDMNDCEAVLFFADWHYGMIADNIFNTYNTDICKKRVAQIVDKAIDKMILHRPRKLHIVLLGDCAHGAIHVSARVESEEKTCDQLMHASELIAEAVAKLSCYTGETVVYSAYGNHLRTVQNKHDSVHSDNMESIVAWWLKERFRGVPNVAVVDNEYYEFVKVSLYGRNLVCIHGDLDNVRQIGTLVNTLFTRVYNEKIDYTVSADKHHLEEFDSLGIENTIVPALCGTDGYANERRLYSCPGQMMMFFNEDGKDAVYNLRVK